MRWDPSNGAADIGPDPRDGGLGLVGILSTKVPNVSHEAIFWIADRPRLEQHLGEHQRHKIPICLQAARVGVETSSYAAANHSAQAILLKGP